MIVGIRCLGLFAALALVGCLSVGPPEEPRIVYYEIELPPPAPAERGAGLTVVLRPFSHDGALEREEIRYRTSDVAGGYFSAEHWAQGVGPMVRGALQADLDAWGGFEKVLLLDNAGRGDLLLVGEVHRFGEVDRSEGWSAVAEITIEATLAREGTVVYHRRFREEERCGQQKAEEVVRALSRATGRIADELRADLARWMATREAR